MEIWENVDDLFLDGEIFKDIDGYDGDYQISNYSRVKSFKKWHGTDVRILSPNKDRGYLRVKLCKNGKEKNKRIHDLMFESFYNYKLKKGEVIHHTDQNKLDNILDNFQLMTNSEHDSLHKSGENHPMFGKKRPEFSGENHPMFGKNHSEKTKELMRENHADVSGKNNPMYGRTGENHPKGMLGKNHSEESKQLMREKNLGKKHPEISEKMSGENNPQVKLKEQDVIKIRELDLLQREIAEMFGITQAAISLIKTGKTWKHIKED